MDSKFFFICLAAEYRTTEAPPVTYPLNLGGGGGKVGTLNITWDPMPVSEWFAGGDKVGYIVYWKKADMEKEQWDHVRLHCLLIILIIIIIIVTVTILDDTDVMSLFIIIFIITTPKFPKEIYILSETSR